MTLKMITGRAAVKFFHKDDAMTVAWDLDASLEGDELLGELRRIVAFMDAQTGSQPLPERIPGIALGMAQAQYPAPGSPEWHREREGNWTPPEGPVGNGWAAMAQPEVPERLQNEVELIPPEEQA